MTGNTKPLEALAERINDGHRAYLATARKALDHALDVGAALQEAKDGLPHGEWLPWLQSNCPNISERSAQRYMRLAKNRDRLKEKYATLADLTVQVADGFLADAAGVEPVPPSSPYDLDDPDWSRFAASLLDAPFGPDDFNLDGVESIRWLKTKMCRQISLPAVVSFCVGFHDDYRVPALRLCGTEELVGAVKILGPLAKGEIKFDFAMTEFSADDLMTAALILKLTAQRLVGLVWGEIDDRQKIEPEQFERQRDKTLTKLQHRIETKIEQHAEGRP